MTPHTMCCHLHMTKRFTYLERPLFIFIRYQCVKKRILPVTSDNECCKLNSKEMQQVSKLGITTFCLHMYIRQMAKSVQMEQHMEEIICKV